MHIFEHHDQLIYKAQQSDFLMGLSGDSHVDAFYIFKIFLFNVLGWHYTDFKCTIL